MPELSGSALEVAESRYLQNGETWQDRCKTIARAVAAVEKDSSKYEEEFGRLIYDMNFMPGGRILRNAGNPRGNLFNCYNIPIKNDSIEAIGQFYKEILIAWKYGGGIGVNISGLRPKGAPILGVGGENGSSGPVSFLIASNAIAKTVESGGSRRAAGFAMMRADHPDIEDFINAKLKHGELSHYNISIGVNEDFLSAVEQDDEWELKFAQKVYRTIPARQLWDKVISNMLQSAEPGIMNIDNLFSNASYYYDRVTCCNACQPSWATVLTPSGISTIGRIKIGDIIWSEDGWVKVINKFENGIKDVYKYRTNAGVVYSTEDHRIVSNGKKVEADKAENIDLLRGPKQQRQEFDYQIVMDGIVLGDGSKHKASNNLVYLHIGDDDYDYFKSPINDFIIKKRDAFGDTAYEIETNILWNELPKTYQRSVPDRYKFGDFNTVKSFLLGMFSANGTVLGKHRRVSLKSSSPKIVEDVQMMLSALGIKSYITKNKSKVIKFSNGKYKCRKSNDINITKDINKFYELIGFIQKYKMERLEKHIIDVNSRDKVNFDIFQKEYISTEEVYDITVDGRHHTYWSGGCNISNCIEVPLEDHGLCLLGSIVLPNHISNINTNWIKLSNTIELAVRFLDNIIDISSYILEPIKMKAHNSRRIGIGITGLGEYLFAKKLRYGSKKAINEIERLMKFIRDEVYSNLIKLSVEKGSFPKFDPIAYGKADFIRTLPPSLRMDIKKYGTRCVTGTALAPAGTISLVCNTTSGIEPLFMKGYRRNDRVSERIYIHPQYKKILETRDEVPEWFVDTTDLTPEDHLNTQVACQKFLDGSISKTVNLPKGFSSNNLSELMLEYIHDLKGVTVYVDGSREGQVLNSITEEEAINYLKEEKVSNSIDEDLVTCKSGACEI